MTGKLFHDARSDRPLRRRWRCRRRGGFHPSHPVCCRPRNDPPGEERPGALPADTGFDLRPNGGCGVGEKAHLWVDRKPRRRIAPRHPSRCGRRDSSPFGNRGILSLRFAVALRSDVAIVHAQRSDSEGNTQVWGLLGVQKEVAFASNTKPVCTEPSPLACPSPSVTRPW